MRIYKYVDSTDNIWRTVEGGTLGFSNPGDFNDPFDSVTVLAGDEDTDRTFSDFTASFLNETRGLWVEYFRLLNGAFIPNTHAGYLRVPASTSFFLAWSLLSPKGRADYADAIVDRFGKDSIPARLARHYAGLRVSCFSSVFDNISCWAHYAKDWHGGCIGIELDDAAIAAAGLQLCEVIYVDEHPTAGESAPSTADLIADSVRYKHIRWREERELRLWGHGDYRSLAIPGRVVEVMFGYRNSTFADGFNKIVRDPNDVIQFSVAVPSSDGGAVRKHFLG